ncbi:MAG: ABC transporter permease [Erysipelotrichaceae bacterium]|nr:ABC transporter permease [Erysipelotrichaceae bacterium]
MKNYTIRRLLQIIPVFLGILFILFFIIDKAPGSITSNIMDPRMTPELKAALQAKLDPKLPFYVKFWNWIVEALHGNFGWSAKHYKPVIQVIGENIGCTFALALAALVIAMLIGIPAGIISATKQYSLIDNFLTVFSLLGLALPTFFAGLLLLKVFAIDLQWLPIFGLTDPSKANAGFWVRLGDHAYHLILPAIVLGLAETASFMRYTRSSMLEVIRSDYIRTARAKGLSEKVIIYKHAFRNAMIPIITLLGFRIPGLISGAVMTETIFSLPGVGKLSVEATTTRNYPLLLGINAMLTLATLLGTLVADLLYAAADPRIKYD